MVTQNILRMFIGKQVSTALDLNKCLEQIKLSIHPKNVHVFLSYQSSISTMGLRDFKNINCFSFLYGKL